MRQAQKPKSDHLFLERSIDSPFKGLRRSPEFLPQIAVFAQSFEDRVDIHIFGPEIPFDLSPGYRRGYRRACEWPKRIRRRQRFPLGILNSIHKHRTRPALAHRPLESHDFRQLSLHALANPTGEEPNVFLRILSFDGNINVETG
ncbi:MAG: hypothetical protein WBW31_20580, partial [Candidatus Sulfotelmatobacter sp.]